MEYHRVRPIYHSFDLLSFIFFVHRSTILSSAGNDGRIRLWKAAYGNVWRPAGSIGVEQAEEQERTPGGGGADVDMDGNPGT
jgi:hypothetical protein